MGHHGKDGRRQDHSYNESKTDSRFEVMHQNANVDLNADPSFQEGLVLQTEQSQHA